MISNTDLIQKSFWELAWQLCEELPQSGQARASHLKMFLLLIKNKGHTIHFIIKRKDDMAPKKTNICFHRTQVF